MQHFVHPIARWARDVEVLHPLENSGVGHVGLVASRQRARDDFEALRKESSASKYIELIMAPVGVDIGAITPS